MRISDWSSDVCSSDLARFDCPLLVVFLTSPTRGASYYMGRPRNDHFKLLLTRDNYLCVALTPMLSHAIPNCPILRAGYGKPCQLFDVVGATDADQRADRKRVVSGKRLSLSVDHGGRGMIKN